jgi:hypothetical protein
VGLSIRPPQACLAASIHVALPPVPKAPPVELEPPVAFEPPVPWLDLPPVAGLVVVPPVAEDPPVAFHPPVVVMAVVDATVVQEVPPVSPTWPEVPPVPWLPPVVVSVVADHVLPPVVSTVSVDVTLVLGRLDDPPVSFSCVSICAVDAPATFSAKRGGGATSSGSPQAGRLIANRKLTKNLVVITFSFYLSYSRFFGVLTCYAMSKNNGRLRFTGVSPRTTSSI